MSEDLQAKPSLLPIGIAISVSIVAVFLSILSLGRAMAGGTSGGSATGDDLPVRVAEVSLTEFALAPGQVQLASGGSIEVVNAGGTAHNLAVKGEDLTTPDLNAGDRATLSLVALTPGTYTLYCTIAGHEAAGMTGTVVLGGADAAAGAATHGRDTGGHASGEGTQAEMEAMMKASLTAFPAETEGEGAVVLAPVVQPDGTKLFELVADEVSWEVEPGKFVDALGYNGAVPGPTMRVAVGDRVTIRVTNNLDDQGTSLHPHGLKNHDFAIDGVTYISQDPIGIGDSMDYTFVAAEEAVMGYHSHHMSLHQVPNGLFGAMIIGDWATLSGFDNVVAEEVMTLNDAGNIGFSLNGKSFPATKPYSYTQGDRVIVHYLNEGQMAHPMHLHNQKGTVIAKDGYLLQPGARYSGDTFNVSPGERLTVVYEMDNVGTWVWHCHILSHVKKADGSMFGMLTAVIIEPRV